MTTAQARAAYERLAATDPVLRRMMASAGTPDPFGWAGAVVADGSRFGAMVLHIVSQQISTTVAVTLFARVEEAAGGRLDAASVATLEESRLHALGLSGAKARAVAGLARMQLTGELDLDGLDGCTDEQAVAALTTARGVGRWTAEMFLIHQLRRPDILPAGDLGIRRAVQAGWGYPATPDIDTVRELGARWSPHRTYAAALLWGSLQPGPPPVR